MASLQRTFHWLVDLLGAVAARLFELPMSFVLVALLAGAALVVLALRLVSARARRWLSGARLGWGGCVFALLGAVVVFDYRQHLLELELRGLERQLAADAARSTGLRAQGFTSTQPVLAARVHAVWPSAEVSVARQAAGIDYAVITTQAPRAVVVHLAIIDLTEATLRIELSSELSTKRRLTEFCRARRCVVGLNGEAGEDPTATGVLGKWVGNLIVRGKPVSLKDDAERPFLAFDQDNRARYVPAAVVERRADASTFNALWGRWDLVVHGKLVERPASPATELPRPRCAMGIDGEGDTLYLVTIDGHQRGYSEGASVRELGALVQAVGATDAMGCDEGGSAAMYLGARSGLISRPSGSGDPQRDERPTFTHFGLSTRGR